MDKQHGTNEEQIHEGIQIRRATRAGTTNIDPFALTSRFHVFEISRLLIVMRFGFWSFVFGVLFLVWGVATLVSRLLRIAIDISWWGLFAIVVGVWLLAYSTRRHEMHGCP